MRTNKIIVRSIVGVAAALAALGSICIAAEEAKPASVPAATVAVPKVVQFDPATYKGETGKITLPYEGQGYMLLGTSVDGKPGDYLMPAYKDGAFVVPVGKYSVVGCGVTKEGKNGAAWSISPNVSGDIEVKAGSTTMLGDGGSLLASIKSGKTGTIVPPSGYTDAGASLIAMDNGKSGDMLSASGLLKPLVVPCGIYRLAGFYINKTDKAGVKWTLSTVGAQGTAAKTIEVKPDSEVKVKLGDSFVASVDVNQTGEKVAMSLKLTNADGESCYIRSTDPKAEAPGFQVLSKSGKVLMSGKFQYG